MNRETVKPTTTTSAPLTGLAYQAIVSGTSFSLGVRCDEQAIERIVFLAPCAPQAPTNALAEEASRQLAAYLADAEYRCQLPLRAQGTPFQRRVWQQIAAIPLHCTRTYGEIARELSVEPSTLAP